MIFYIIFYKFREVKNYFNYWVGVVKNEHDLWGHGNLKLLYYLKSDWVNCADFLHADTDLGKLKVNSIVRGWP